MGMTTKGLCPYCGTREVSFEAVFDWNASSGQRALFLCGHCDQGVIREVVLSGNQSLTRSNGDINKYAIFLGTQWPQGVSTDAPPDCPENVGNFYRQAVDSLNSGNFDAAGTMFRKSLEAATKNKAPALVGKPLVQRIDALVADGTLTKEMGKWAHEIRLGGNDAAHEEEPFTREQATGLHDFAENFLRYSFTLPAAVERRSSSAG